MNTFVVWVLVLTTHGAYQSNSPAVTIIDNISTRQQCNAVARAIHANDRRARTLCVSVRKTK